MPLMKISKHSYIFSKDFILCCLGEDKHFFYGEIIYGMKKMKGVKVIKIDNFHYYKYWGLEHLKKTNHKKMGEETSYMKYFILTKKLYPNYHIVHPIMGNLFRISKREVKNTILPPKKFRPLNKIQKEIFDFLKIKFSLSNKEILIGGSNLIDKGTDFDVLIKGKSAGIKASKILEEVTKNKGNRILIDKNKFHSRRFYVNKEIICPFSIYKNDNFFEIAKPKQLRSSQKITAEVIDSSESLFSPAQYKIKVGKEIFLLVSYFVGHSHLFKKGEIIKFRAPLFQFSKGLIKKKAFVIPIQGSWVDINGRSWI